MSPATYLIFILSAALAGLTLGACDGAPAEADSGEIITIAGTGVAGFSGESRPAIEANLYLPMDIIEGPDGRLYVVDFNNQRIRVIGDDGRIQTVAGTGNYGTAEPGPAREADLTHPTHVAFDELGRMVIAVLSTSKIVRVDLTTGQLEHMCGTGDRDYTGDDGPAAEARFDRPAAVAHDAAGNLYVMDQFNQVIRKVDGSGTITRFAGQCVIENMPHGPCMPGETPAACEGSNKRSCTVDDDPEYGCGPFALCTPGFAGDGDPALEARLGQFTSSNAPPAGRMVFDAGGNMYFADSYNHRIRRIDTDGVITTVAGDGTRGYAGDGGPASQAQLDRPVDLELAGDGTLYVADTGNSCVRAIAPDGIIRTVAGRCGQRGFDGELGPATEALLDRPYGIALDRDGNLYIADTHNHRIRMVPR